VGLQLPVLSDTLFEEMDVRKMARNALRIYLFGASWVDSERDVNELSVLLPDPEQRRVVLN
jgi:hypothetical protein